MAKRKQDSETVSTQAKVFQERFIGLVGDKTQQETADIIGVTRQTVSNWLSGAFTPDITAICKIADAFDVSTDYLLGRTEIMLADEEIQTVCNVTGLSEVSATYLKAHNILGKEKTICNENGEPLVQFAGDERLYGKLKTLNTIIETEKKYGLLVLITEYLLTEFKNPFAKESDVSDDEFVLVKKINDYPHTDKYVFKTELISEALLLKINESLKKIKEDLNQEAGD